MHVSYNVPLAQFSSFGSGGLAEELVEIHTTQGLQKFFGGPLKSPLWLLGYGTNCLISDEGLPGVTVIMRGGSIEIIPTEDGALITADASVWWDDVVQKAIAADLWGIELMSGIPGSVGAAVVGNVAAYGQAISDSLVEITTIDKNDHSVHTLPAADLGLAYRSSDFQTDRLKSHIIATATFKVSNSQTTPLTYQSALDTAESNKLDPNNLQNRRHIIMSTRAAAGSLIDPAHTEKYAKTAGSFFKNPTVSASIVQKVAEYDESGRTAAQLSRMSQVHSGTEMRIPAALLLLASGFKRGQSWGPVRLHQSHVQKIENAGGASSQQIYDVAQEIIETVRQKFDLTLTPEVRFIGNFNNKR